MNKDSRIVSRVRSLSTPRANEGRALSTLRSCAASALSTPSIFVLLGLGGWSLLILLTNPSGAFPLNDDWSYSRAVETLVNHGRLQFTDFTSMTLIAQVAWGALFCLPFGFSFLALRLSTLTLGAVGILATYLLVREVRADRRTAALAASIVAFNPLYFSLSFTFMTDVPFLAISMLSLLFFVRSFRTEATHDILAGYAFATVAILIRQNGAILPVAFALVYLFKHRISRRGIQYGLVPLAIELALVGAYPLIIDYMIGLPFYYISARGVYGALADGLAGDWTHVLTVIGETLMVETLYLGLFVLPLTIVLIGWVPRTLFGRRKPWRLWAGAALTVTLGAVVLALGRVMPLSGNVLYDLGLGPPLLRDTYALGLPHLPQAPREFWLAVTVAAVIGGVPLVLTILTVGYRAVSTVTSIGQKLEPAILLVSIVAIGHLVNTAVTTTSPSYSLFDRYFIFALVPAMMLLVHQQPRPPGSELRARWATAIALTLAYGVFAVGATHDYLAWNRERWDAARDLLRRGIPAEQINGGFEFNGWYRFDEEHLEESLQSAWSRGDGYMLAFGPVNGYEELRRYHYSRWMPPGRGRIVVLRRHALHEP